MELRQVRYFLSICEHEGFSRASEACGVTQPALTKAMKLLEAELGGELFHREGRRLVLSELGRILRPHLKRLTGEQDAALTVAKNFSLLRQVPLRLGILPTIGPLRVARFLGEFRNQHPGVELAVSESSAEELARQLERAELDLAIANSAAGFGDAYRTKRLYTERYLVIFPPGHRFQAMSTVRLADLDGENYVDRLACEMREMVVKVLGECSVRLYAKYRSEREDWVQAMVTAGLGVAFMPEYSVTVDGPLSRLLVEPDVAREVHAVEVRGRRRSPASDLFMREIASFRWPG